MSRLAFALALSLLSGAAFAQRPLTLAMSCGEAAGLVLSRGAIVLGTGTHTYDRYVATPGYCNIGEYAERAWVPTRDVAQCPVGYQCKYGPPFFDDY